MVSFQQLKENLFKKQEHQAVYVKEDGKDETVDIYIQRLHFIRLSGLIGALAVALGAYGAHVLSPDKEISDERKRIFITGNFYHFVHALALLGVPLTNRPTLVGALLTIGIVIFSGSCYITGITGNTEVATLTPYGGIALILGWISMMI